MLAVEVDQVLVHARARCAGRESGPSQTMVAAAASLVAIANKCSWPAVDFLRT